MQALRHAVKMLKKQQSPDEGFRREAETSINSMLFLVVLE